MFFLWEKVLLKLWRYCGGCEPTAFCHSGKVWVKIYSHTPDEVICVTVFSLYIIYYVNYAVFCLHLDDLLF